MLIEDIIKSSFLPSNWTGVLLSNRACSGIGRLGVKSKPTCTCASSLTLSQESGVRSQESGVRTARAPSLRTEAKYRAPFFLRLNPHILDEN